MRPAVVLRIAASIGLVSLCFLPWSLDWIGTTVAIVVLGVPHGALDGEIARPLLRPRFGRWWFVAFALPYLGLSAGVLACWRWAPVTTLAAFLAASAWHFGAEDTPVGKPLTAFVRGGLPIAAPVLLHPAATCAIFAAATQGPFVATPAWLRSVCLAWLAVALSWAAGKVARGEWRACVPVAGVGAMFLVLPPLTAFAIYFVTVHAPAHIAWVVRHPTFAPRARNAIGAVRLSLPVTLLTFGLGATLWPSYAGVPAVRLLGLTLQGLAALTLPHMLLGHAASAIYNLPAQSNKQDVTVSVFS